MTKNRESSQFESVASLLPELRKPPTAPKKLKPPKQGRRLALPTDTAFDNPQLSLFQSFLCNTLDQQDALSNAIDRWDSVPRYKGSRQETDDRAR